MPLSPQDHQLFNAIQAQDMQAAQQAVQAGANINVQTLERTPLHAAVNVKHLGLVQWLVEQGADINLTDKDFKTPIEIAAASKQADILAYLLAHRQSLSASQLNYILMACVAKHPTTETEDYRVDTQLVNFIVSRLTRLNVHALLTTNRNWERVIVQLFSIKGEKREDTVLSEGASAEQLKKEGAWVGLEGWRQHEFLAIRIRALFELYLRISVEDMRKQALYLLLQQATADANVAAILNALQQELLTTIETLATYHDALAIKNFVSSKRVQLRQAIARNVTAKVQALADGKEYPLACGWGDAIKGHALYVSLMVYPQHIIPRIDNTDVDNNQDAGKSYHHYINEQRLRDGQMVNKVLSYVPGQWDKLETELIQKYVEALLEATVAGKAVSFVKIYQPAVGPLTVSLNLPGTQIQTIGNCPVKNHHVGLRIRLKDKAFYRWVRGEESKIIISLHAAKGQSLDISAYWTLWQSNLTVEVTPSTAAFHLQTHLLRSLKASYAKHGYINRLFSAYTNHQEDSLAINKSYIHLAITPEETQKQKEQQAFKNLKPANTAQLSQAIYENTETVDMQQLFESAKAKGKQQIAVIGRPGVGKSTFCQYVTLQWAEGADWLRQFQWLFWIEARNLKSNWYEKKSYYELIDIVARECFNRPLSNLEVAILQQAIDQNRVLWLFDGHDALAGQTLPGNLDEIVESLLAKAPLLMTSRPLYLKLSPTFFRVEITGFTPDDIDLYVHHFFNALKTPQPDKANQLLEYMRQNPYAGELGRLPLNLELLCSVYLKETLQGHSILTQTDLYRKIMAWLLRRYLIERKKIKPEKIDDDAHALETCEEVVPGLLPLIKQLAFDEFYAGNTILSQTVINRYRNTLLKDKSYTGKQWLALKNELGQLGLLTKAYRGYESTSPNDEDYYFIHPTFQEFMVAWTIAEQFMKEQSLIFLKAEEQEIIPLETFIAQYKYHPRYEIVWWFSAGLLAKQPGNGRLFHVLFDNKPIDEIKIYHTRLMIRILNEGQCDGELLDRSIRYIIELFKASLSFNTFESLLNSWLEVLKFSPLLVNCSQMQEFLKTQIEKKPIDIWDLRYEGVKGAFISLLNETKDTNEYLEILRPLLTSAEQKDVWAAKYSLQEKALIKPFEVLDILEKLLAENDLKIKRAVTYIIGELIGEVAKFEPERALTIFIPLLKDPDSTTRHNMAQAIFLNTKLLIPLIGHAIIFELLNDKSWIIRRYAFYFAKELLLTDSLKKIIDFFEPYLTTQDEKIINAATEAIWQAIYAKPEDEVLSYFESWRKDDNWQKRKIAAGAICRAASMVNPEQIQENVIEIYQSFLNDIASQVREVVVESLQRMIETQATKNISIKSIFNLLQQSLLDAHPNVRIKAIKAFGKIAHEFPRQVINLLSPLIINSDIEIKAEAIKAIAQFVKILSKEEILRIVNDIKALVIHNEMFLRSSAIYAIRQVAKIYPLEALAVLKPVWTNTGWDDMECHWTLGAIDLSQYPIVLDITLLRYAREILSSTSIISLTNAYSASKDGSSKIQLLLLLCFKSYVEGNAFYLLAEERKLCFYSNESLCKLDILPNEQLYLESLLKEINYLLFKMPFQDCLDYKPIHFAVINNNFTAIESMLKDQPNLIETITYSGDTPLHLAARYAEAYTVKLLLANNADHQIKNYSDHTAWNIAKNLGRSDILKLLPGKSSFDPDRTFLSTACYDANIEVVSYLLKRGEDPNVSDKQGRTPLHFVASNGQLAIAKLLIAAKANLEEKDKQGDTPLHVAACMGHLGIVEILLTHNADVNAVNLHDSVLHQGVHSGKVEVVKMILDHNATIDIEDKEGDTPLEWASEKNAQGIPLMELLLAHGANINHQNKVKNGLLHLLVQKKYYAAIEFLINRGIDVNLRNSENKTAIEIAFESGNERLKKLFEELIHQQDQIKSAHSAHISEQELLRQQQLLTFKNEASDFLDANNADVAQALEAFPCEVGLVNSQTQHIHNEHEEFLKSWNSISEDSVKDNAMKKQDVVSLRALKAHKIRQSRSRSPSPVLIEHTFIYQTNHTVDVDTVHLAGDFKSNNWLNSGNINTWEMKKITSNEWQLMVTLKPGIYAFKYLINRGKHNEWWEKDIDSRYEVSQDGYNNSIVHIINPSDKQNEKVKEMRTSFMTEEVELVQAIALPLQIGNKAQGNVSVELRVECQSVSREMGLTSEQNTIQKHKQEIKSLSIDVVHSGIPVFFKKPFELVEAKQATMYEYVFNDQEEIIDQDFFNQFDDDFDDDDLDIGMDIKYKR